jgi:hypothetical protein
LELEDVSSGCKFIHRDSLHAGQNLIYYLTDQRILLDTLACGWYKLSLTASPSYLDATWSVEDTNNRTLSGMDTAFFGSSQMPVSQTYQDSLAVLWPYDLWVRFKGQSHNPRCFGQYSVLLLADQNYLYKYRPAPVIFRDGERLRVKDSILVEWYRNEIYVQTSLDLEILSIGAYKARFCEGTCCSEFSNIIEKTSGLDEFDPGLLVIYPNPSTGDFVLEAPNDFLIEAEIQVFDLRGKHKDFECQMLSSGKMSISTDLSPGIYLIALKSASGLIYKTIVLY